MPNITLKRDAPFRGGFEGLLFFRLRRLRQSSVTGARALTSTLGGRGLCGPIIQNHGGSAVPRVVFYRRSGGCNGLARRL